MNIERKLPLTKYIHFNSIQLSSHVSKSNQLFPSSIKLLELRLSNIFSFLVWRCANSAFSKVNGVRVLSSYLHRFRPCCICFLHKEQHLRPPVHGTPMAMGGGQVAEGSKERNNNVPRTTWLTHRGMPQLFSDGGNVIEFYSKTAFESDNYRC